MANILRWLNNAVQIFMGIEVKEEARLINEKNQDLIIIKEPIDFNSSKEIVDELKKDKIVIFNLDNLSREEARRVIDFISGASYASGYSLRSNGKMVYTCESTPGIFKSDEA